MYLEIEELKKRAPNAMSMQEYVGSLRKDEPTVILRNYNEPMTPPCMESKVKVFDFEKKSRTVEDVKNAYGTRPNVPGINVFNAIKAALGPGSYCIHMSDGSYTGYSMWELNEFLRNFDDTNLRVWIAETFDCDDFSQVVEGNVNGFFPGIALGTIWYGPKDNSWGHSVNIFYSYTDNKVYLVEPQNDTFYEFNKELWNAWVVMI
jgi:hypothetical protein